MEFPKWAPKSVIDEWKKTTEEEGESDVFGIASMLQRLLTDARMEWVWGRLRVLAEKYPKPFDVPSVFAQTAVIGFYGPTGKIGRMPTKKRERWVSDVEETAVKLARLITDTRLDEYLWRDFKKAKIRVFRIGAAVEKLTGVDCHTKKCIDAFAPPLLSELLFRLSGEVEEAEKTGKFPELKDTSPQLGKPTAPYARRQFFVLTLTGFFISDFNKPYRKMVAEVTSVAFQQVVAERQVIRLASCPGT